LGWQRVRTSKSLETTNTIATAESVRRTDCTATVARGGDASVISLADVNPQRVVAFPSCRRMHWSLRADRLRHAQRPGLPEAIIYRGRRDVEGGAVVVGDSMIVAAAESATRERSRTRTVTVVLVAPTSCVAVSPPIGAAVFPA
jgi:hypothetical protein